LLSQFGANREQALIQYQTFVEKLQRQIQAKPSELKEIPKAQRRSVGRSFSYYVESFSNTKEGMKQAYETGHYTMQQIADAFAVHYSTVSRAVNNSLAKNT
jgi:predicted transcriptional regulator